MLITTERILRRTLLLSLAGTRGGPVRLEILLMLDKKPLNTNEIAKRLSIDYKTAQHHMRVLEKSGIVISSKKKYGNEYKLSEPLKSMKHVLLEMWGKVDKPQGE